MQPLLREYNANVTFFVSQYKKVGSNHFPATILNSLQNDGNEIGIHTADHFWASEYLSLKNKSTVLYINEQCLAEEKEMVPDGIYRPMSMAYPYGDSGSYDLRNEMPKYYRNIRGTVTENTLVEGTYKDTDSIFYKFDNSPNNTAGTLDTIGLNEKLIFDAIDRAVENGEVVQLLSHRVDPVAQDYGISCEFFENILNYTKSHGGAFYTYGQLHNDLNGENWGSATIKASATTVNVTHGLSATPTKVIISPTADIIGKRYWVSAKGRTTFTITIDSAAASNITFDWVAVE
jgi:peptidoglycan/xylan/chitin deacetylase (PgdA/CDA1 family)